MGRMFRQILDTFTRVAMGRVRRRPAPPPCAGATWRTRWRFFDGSDPSNRHRDGVGTTGAAGGPHVIASIFGARLAQRLATRLIFEGDPLRDQDPIGRTIPDMGVLDRLVTPLDLKASVSLDGLACRFDILLHGHRKPVF